MHEDALPMFLQAALSEELKQQLINVSKDILNQDYRAYAKHLQELENCCRYFATMETPNPRPTAPTPRYQTPRATPIATIPEGTCYTYVAT